MWKTSRTSNHVVGAAVGNLRSTGQYGTRRLHRLPSRLHDCRGALHAPAFRGRPGRYRNMINDPVHPLTRPNIGPQRSISTWVSTKLNWCRVGLLGEGRWV